MEKKEEEEQEEQEQVLIAAVFPMFQFHVTRTKLRVCLLVSQ